MTDKTSSCSCSNNTCKNDDYYYFKRYEHNIKPSNLSIANCHVDSNLNNCSNYRVHLITSEPKIEQDNTISIINKNTGISLSKDFKNYKNTKYWHSNDPRLSKSHSGQRILLDRPPSTSNIVRDNIYNEDMINYGKNYKTYSDINAGHIHYYFGERQSQTYSEPNYVLKSKITNSTFKDPMGGISPQYNKHTYLKDNAHISDYQFNRDEISFREDIMKGYTSKIHRNDWSSMWNK